MTASILFDNRFLDNTPVASSTASGFDARNITDLKSFTYWKSASGASHTIVVDCGSAKSADTVAILNHNLLSIGGSFSVEYSTDNFATNTVAMATFYPDSNNLIYRQFTSATARYWRISISGLGAFVAVATLGVRFTFDTEIQGEFSPGVETIKADHSMTRYGDALASTSMARMMSASLTWGFMLDASFRSTFKAAWDAHIGLCRPFFIATDYANNPRDIYFYRVKPSSETMSGYNFQNRRSLKLDMIGVADYGNGYGAINAPPLCVSDYVSMTSPINGACLSCSGACSPFTSTITISSCYSRGIGYVTISLDGEILTTLDYSATLPTSIVNVPVTFAPFINSGSCRTFALLFDVVDFNGLHQIISPNYTQTMCLNTACP